MADAGMLVRSLYEAYQRRDWDACVPLIHPEATYDLPRTDEHVDGGAAILDYQRAYPEPWGELAVLRVVAEGDEARPRSLSPERRAAIGAWRRSGRPATVAFFTGSSTGLRWSATASGPPGDEQPASRAATKSNATYSAGSQMA
jgi:ketosteroid isomerase-like protein